MEELIECINCHDSKDISEYYKRDSEKKFRQPCKSCSKKKRKDRRRNQKLKSYRINQDEFNNLLKFQDNRCAICGNEFMNQPCIDHDHITGQIRGLLCINCNVGLGSFKDDITILRLAIIYLENLIRGENAEKEKEKDSTRERDLLSGDNKTD